MLRILVIVSLSLLCVAAQAADAPAVDELIATAVQKFRSGKTDEAIALATQATAAAPRESRVWLLRAAIYERQHKFDEAIADLTRAIQLEPDRPDGYQLRGVNHFKAGHINESIADFDRFIELRPEQDAHHWQRGISYYYAGCYSDGRKQFERHQTVNPQDVENAVWHFLCTTRESGLAEARKHLILITRDSRVPMAEIQALFAGEGTEAAVLKAAEAGDPPAARRNEQLFYAHLYLGLYYEATGDEAKAREHILTAADKYPSEHYMGDVARVHAARLRAAEKK
ncbi:MAG: tetratricopeptide repeat protein [Planctomycetes bacterium]|nr:tetratricopeptide repeat protein [Planctomycetota bacterium]